MREEKFPAKIINFGSSLGIIIPAIFTESKEGEFKEGDKVRVTITKDEEE